MEQMTLGAMISALEACDKSKPVRMACGLSLCSPHSYRGYYNHLALEPCCYEVKVLGLLSDLRDALGKEFTGYKGGSYLMTAGTEVWVATHGDTSIVFPVAIRELDNGVLIETALEDE